jgi:hypothetical protein
MHPDLKHRSAEIQDLHQNFREFTTMGPMPTGLRLQGVD